ncbi:MAG TPA: hypothetical protein VGI39_06305 [Polyangiaceae bacterium]
MKREVYVEGRRFTLDPSRLVGRGGEAEVFATGDGRALKVFKGPDHPEFAGHEPSRRAAEARLALHQKKLRDFPAGLPAEVVAPRALATDRSGRAVLGYAMELVTGAEPLWKYGDGAFRRAGVPGDAVVALFRALLRVVRALHAAGVILGDFNDQNVLVLVGGGHAPRVIDTDSFQFGAYPCPVYSERFLDPRLCDPSAPAPTPVRAYDVEADWFAFNVLLFQSLLFVGPYGGIHRPKDPASRVAPAARSLRRLTVFDRDVQYPKPAAPYQILPDDLLHHFEGIFAKDDRAPFPVPLLERLAFTSCAGCGTEHARTLCPKCARTTTVRAAAAVVIHGAVHAERVFRTPGVLVCVAVQGGDLRVVHHHDGAYQREDGRVILTGLLDPSLRFRVRGADTLVGRGVELATVAKDTSVTRRAVDSDGAAPAFDTSERHLFWVQDGRLWRGAPSALDPHAAEAVGEVLAQQTRIFAGAAFGIGFYRAGAVSRAFLFDGERRGIDDRLSMPPLPGVIVDAAAALDDQRAWLFLAHRHAGKVRHLCLVYARSGALEGSAEGEPGDGGWLSTLHGKCAAGGLLFAATDAGLVRVEVAAGSVAKTRDFPDTAELVDEGSRLLVGRRGLYVAGAREVLALEMK